ncbi:MAG: HEAT repeat domain-containing protein [Pirellulaceae bacterium]
MNEPTRATDAPESSAAGQTPVTAQAHAVPPGLILVPLLVVVVFVIAWWLVLRWLNADYDPHELLRDMRAPSHNSWQQAYAFSELLRDPRHAALKEDTTLCRDLAAILDEQLRQAGQDPAGIQFQVFLCRALGEFRVADGLPALLRAAAASADEARIEVRCAVLEALAVLAGNLTPGALREDPRVLTLLLDASRETDAASAAANKNRVASTATFALGVVGGPTALHRLQQLLDDPRPDVRYNAATGLARHGDVTAIPVLLEMLAAADSSWLNDESSEAVRARKLAWLVSNAIHASVRLVETNPQADRQPLLGALDRLGEASNLPVWVRLEVQAAQAQMQEQTSALYERGGL